MKHRTLLASVVLGLLVACRLPPLPVHQDDGNAQGEQSGDTSVVPSPAPSPEPTMAPPPETHDHEATRLQLAYITKGGQTVYNIEDVISEESAQRQVLFLSIQPEENEFWIGTEVFDAQKPLYQSTLEGTFNKDGNRIRFTPKAPVEKKEWELIHYLGYGFKLAEDGTISARFKTPGTGGLLLQGKGNTEFEFLPYDSSVFLVTGSRERRSKPISRREYAVTPQRKNFIYGFEDSFNRLNLNPVDDVYYHDALVSSHHQDGQIQVRISFPEARAILLKQFNAQDTAFDEIMPLPSVSSVTLYAIRQGDRGHVDLASCDVPSLEKDFVLTAREEEVPFDGQLYVRFGNQEERTILAKPVPEDEPRVP